jgi:ABC-type transport system substrate-binding protein
MRVAGRRSRRAAGTALAVIAIATTLALHGLDAVRAARTDVTIGAAAPGSLDPAGQGDVQSAAITAQLFESLTTFDAGLVLRPALAAGWDVSADGRQVVFHLRPNLEFSDGSPLTPADVVRSWLRIADPARPSPLVSLMLDVKGVREHLSGAPGTADPSTVGIRASGSDVVVDLDRPGADFPSIVASPTFAVVPPFTCTGRALVLGQCGVSSGGYTLEALSDTELTLTANPRYWAGPPAITRVHVLTDLGGRSPVDVYSDGDVDYVQIAANDASWIRYDATLGPDLRELRTLSLTYLGLDTARPPFSDVRVRQAIGKAVDWARIVELGAFSGDIAAGSMVPPGIPGRDDQRWLPAHDPDAARALLAQAGFPGGKGFPEVVLAGGTYTEAIAADLKRELGIAVRLELYDDYFDRLATDPPAMWILSWVADYPGQNDFLGVLLGSGSPSNNGRWSSTTFDEAVRAAQSARDPEVASKAFATALGVVASDVPVVPLSYPGSGWALSREGLLGAGQSGLGIPRYAGLAWAP